MKKSNGHTEIKVTRDKRFRVRYIGANGEILAVSEVLNSKMNCEKNIKAMGKIFKS